MTSPELSVIMSTYNREEMVMEAVESVLNQTFSNFEFIIIDDNSTDNTYEKLKSIKDSRIKLFKNNQNCGCTFNYHTAQNIAKGEYIAHIDDDDISFLNRFEIQINYMKNNPDIALSGTYIETFGENARPSWVFYSSPEEIDFICNLFNPLCHSSIIYRKLFMEKNCINYDISKKCAQDYDFYKQILLKGGKLSNIEKVLVRYRMHKNRLTDIKQTQDIQIFNAQKVQKELLLRFLKEENLEEFLYLTSNFPFNDYNAENTEKGIYLLKDAITDRTPEYSEKIDKIIADLKNNRFRF